MRNFAYLIGDREIRRLRRRRPMYAANDLVDALEADGMHLSGVLVTHHHPDHVGGSMMGFELKGLAELLERVSVPVHVNTHEAEWVSRVTGIARSDLTAHEHGDVVGVGDIDIELLHTPATPGSCAFCSTTASSPVTPCFRGLWAHRLSRRQCRRHVPQPAAARAVVRRPHGISRPLVLRGAERLATNVAPTTSTGQAPLTSGAC